jgi:hypothetical protein
MGDVTDVEMPGEEHVSAGGGELLHRHAGPADQMLVSVTGRQVERVVGDHDPDEMILGGLQPPRGAFDLCSIQAAAAVKRE